MSERYHVETPISADRVVLAGGEAHHLIHVMRARPGSRVVLFDGSGAEFPARVERTGRTNVELAVLAREEIDRELPLDVTLGVALPKGDRQRWLVEKATELGVRRLVPLRSARSVAQPRQQVLNRLRRGVIEASKQCGRNRLMEIAEPRAWAQFVADTRQWSYCVLAHPDGSGERAELPRVDPSEKVLLAVGPEGGLTDEEVSSAVAAGWQVIDLGPRVLRTETAAIALAAMVARSVH